MTAEKNNMVKITIWGAIWQAFSDDSTYITDTEVVREFADFLEDPTLVTEDMIKSSEVLSLMINPYTIQTFADQHQKGIRAIELRKLIIDTINDKIKESRKDGKLGKVDLLKYPDKGVMKYFFSKLSLEECCAESNKELVESYEGEQNNKFNSMLFYWNTFIFSALALDAYLFASQAQRGLLDKKDGKDLDTVIEFITSVVSFVFRVNCVGPIVHYCGKKMLEGICQYRAQSDMKKFLNEHLLGEYESLFAGEAQQHDDASGA